MRTFSKASLENLKSRIDLVDVLNSHIKLQKSGAAFKATCPFHDEKTPSFMIKKGDSHYHCYGCGAHGDAIQFLMAYLKMGFADAVVYLAERYQVPLEEATSNEKEEKGPSKTAMKDALERACQFYQFCLLHTMEGHAALDYLYSRGITLDFIKTFQLGLAPKQPLFLKVMREHRIPNEILESAGLMSRGREFFSDRITVPIRDAVGAVIGFSARKYKTDTFGGKYINTPETPLFKKSRVLFGLSYSRKNIAKLRKALIVEGQIDALRLIYSGFNWTVAGQGTAFGEEHAKELIHLGTRTVYLAFDGDTAGQEAAVKVGNIFQKEGIDIFVVPLPEKSDPDVMLQEKGPEEWQKMLDTSIDYLKFLVHHLSKTINIQSPAGKNELVQTIAAKIRTWDHPLMVHESLRKLAHLTQTPEAIVGTPEQNSPQIYIKRAASVTFTEVDPDRILEADLLRWLFLMAETEPKLLPLARLNLKPEHFRHAPARAIFEKYVASPHDDLLTFTINLEQAEQQLFLAELLQKRVNREKALPDFITTIQKLLERAWMREREEIKLKIYSGASSEAEVLQLARTFDDLKKHRPEVQLPAD